MSWSLNEIESLARKAAKGAGLPWGLAEEAGKATRWLCAAGWPGAEVLAAHLQQIEHSDPQDWMPQMGGAQWVAKGGRLCPIRTGALISDLGSDWASGKGVTLAKTAYPLLLVPYMVWAADRTGAALGLSWDGFAISRSAGETTVHETQAGTRDAASVEMVSLSVVQASLESTITRTYRASPSTEAIDILSAFADRTYAPETEESRLSGAGAGLTDND